MQSESPIENSDDLAGIKTDEVKAAVVALQKYRKSR